MFDDEEDIRQFEHKPDPSICPHGNRYIRCKEPECIEEMDRAEAAAYCPHGFLAGCPTCR